MLINKIVKLRMAQSKSIAFELGNYAVFGLAALLIIFFIIFKLFESSSYSILISILTLLSIATMHVKRSDFNFVSSKLSQPYFWFIIEYFLLCSPLIVLSLARLQWTPILILLIGILLIPFLKIKTRYLVGLPITNRIPTRLYEVKSGLRKTSFVPLVLLLLAYGTAWLYIVPLIFLWLISTAICVFFDENESIDFLTIKNEKANTILNKKIMDHLWLFALAYLPVLIINSLFHQNAILINFLFLLSQLLLIVFIIIFKFKHYIPNFKTLSNGNFTAAISLATAIPYLLFVPILFAIFYYNSAIKNLERYIQ